MGKVLDAYRSFDEPKELVVLQWDDLNDQTALWARLWEILAALGAMEDALGPVSGGLRVVHERPDAPGDSAVARWPVELRASDRRRSLAELRSRYERAIRGETTRLVPEFSILKIQANVFLPADVEAVHVLDWDLPDLDGLGPLPLERVPDLDAVADEYVCWRTNDNQDDDESPLFVQIAGESGSVANGVTLWLCSRLDLFRPKRFGGKPAEPHGIYNFQRLCRLFEEVARRTSGRAEIPDWLA